MAVTYGSIPVGGSRNRYQATSGVRKESSHAWYGTHHSLMCRPDKETCGLTTTGPHSTLDRHSQSDHAPNIQTVNIPAGQRRGNNCNNISRTCSDKKFTENVCYFPTGVGEITKKVCNFFISWHKWNSMRTHKPLEIRDAMFSCLFCPAIQMGSIKVLSQLQNLLL